MLDGLWGNSWNRQKWGSPRHKDEGRAQVLGRGPQASHLHKVALKDREVPQLVELAAQEVALKPSGSSLGVGWKQGTF